MHTENGFIDKSIVNGWLVRLFSFAALCLLSTLVFIATEALAQQKINTKQWQELAIVTATTRVEVGNLTATLDSNTKSFKALERQFSNSHFATAEQFEKLSTALNDRTNGLDRRITILETKYD